MSVIFVVLQLRRAPGHLHRAEDVDPSIRATVSGESTVWLLDRKCILAIVSKHNSRRLNHNVEVI